MNPQLRTISQLMLLCLLVGLIYSPVFWAEPCLLEDVALLRELQGDTYLDLKEILTPDSANFTYYRPVVAVSYWGGNILWNASCLTMHIENAVFHMLNVLLLFGLIRISLPKSRVFSQYVPFLGALLFAVHPIATESVNWIVGRSDLIACGILLSATISVMAWRNNRSHWWQLVFGIMLLAVGIMTKELAWGFLLVLPFLLAEPYDSRTCSLGEFFGKLLRLVKLLLLTGVALCFFLPIVTLKFWPAILMGSVLGLVVLYLKPRQQPLSKKVCLLVSGVFITGVALLPYCLMLARQGSSSGNFFNFKRTVFLISHDFDNSIGIFSAAVAFYIKKFFLPLPLSFSIANIASGYLFAGIAVIILTIFLVVWRSQAAILFLIGLALLLPALPLVYNQISWTPYAERYIYVSSSFWIASLVVGLASVKQPLWRTSWAALCLMLITTSAIITYRRSTVWQTNVALFGDTAQKSPDHLESQILYMKALSLAGRWPEAMGQYRKIQADPRSWKRIKYFNDLAELLYKQNLKREAWEVLDSSLTNPLPLGKKHPLKDDEWERLYKFHTRLQLER